MTNLEEHSKPSRFPAVPLVRTLRAAAVAEMFLSEHPQRWLAGLRPIAPSLSDSTHRTPIWGAEVLAALDIDRAHPGGPGLFFARALLEDFGQLVLDLVKVGARATPQTSPELTSQESRELTEACSAAHVALLGIYEDLETSVFKVVTSVNGRIEADTRPENGNR